MKSKLTPEVRERILARLELGAAFADAALAAGVRPETARSWLTRGRKQASGIYADFAAAVEQARRSAQSRPAPMDAGEFRTHLEAAVRAGSVQAMKLWVETYSDSEPPDARTLLGL